jgi:hypothetical protein
VPDRADLEERRRCRAHRAWLLGALLRSR